MMQPVAIHRPRRGAADRPLLAVAVSAALLGLAFAGWIYDFAQRGMAPAIPLSGLIGPARIAELRFAQLKAQGRVDRSLAAAAREVAARDRLAYEPYLWAGAVAFPSDNSPGDARSARILEEALRRNPRSRQARVFLLRHALAQGQVGASIAQIALLDRLDRDYAQVLMGGLGKMIATPQQIDEANRALATYPGLYKQFIAGFTATRKPAPLVARLVATLPAAVAADAAISGPLVTQLIDTGQVKLAHALWQRAAGLARTPGLLANPDFAPTRLRPPFAWEFVESPDGVAERQPDGGVFVDYYGRNATSLVRQLVTLPAGRYRLRLVYEPSGAAPGSLALRVSCASSDAQYAQAPLAGGEARRVLMLDVAIPSGCPGQWIELVGLANADRREQQAVLRRLDLTRAAS